MRTWDLEDIDRRSEADLDYKDGDNDSNEDDDDWRDEYDPAEDEDR